MSDLTLILLAAGDATRFEKSVKKQWLRIDKDPLWLYVAKKFESFSLFSHIVIAAHPEEIEYMKRFCSYDFVAGGSSRQESLLNALGKVKTKQVLVSDVARVCITKRVCQRLIENIGDADCAVLALKSSDTVYYDGAPIDRDKLLQIQTPQLSKTEKLIDALSKYGKTSTDESSAIYRNGGEVVFCEGDFNLRKLTFSYDIKSLPCLKSLKPDNTVTFSGNGFDIHAFEDKKEMVLCGVKIDSGYGFKAHSDGDVAIHALIDALLGAAGMGDIGEHFPDSDSKYKDADSKELLIKIAKNIRNFGYEIIQVDITIIAQQPKISPYKKEMRSTITKLLNIREDMVNIKATTSENLGFIGRKEGVAVIANANLKFYDWNRE